MKRSENSSRIIYTPHPDATPEGELNALATVYSFVLQRHEEKKKAVCGDGPSDAKGVNEHDRATQSISP